MRASIVTLSLLSFATLLWVMRTGEQPATAADQDAARPGASLALSSPHANAAAGLPVGTMLMPRGDSTAGPALSDRARRITKEFDESTAPPTSERDLLKDGAWAHIERTRRLAATQEGFNKLLQMLASSSSVEISQRQVSYQNLFMSDPLYLSGDLQVGQVTCGESVCAAFVTGADLRQLSAFIARLRASQRPPIYSLAALDAPAAANRSGKRLIFSINLVRDAQFSIRRRTRSLAAQ